MSAAWDPPSLALLALGVAALLAWLVLSPPSRRIRISAGLQIAAALLLVLALANAGWRRGGSERPRLAVLLDRSASMDEVGAGGATRLEAARAWLESEAFARVSAGWRVEVDSFGGARSDPAAAIEAAAAVLPAAVLVVSDGRATGGRVAAAPPMPLYAWVPGPAAVPDAAVLDLQIEEGEDGARAAVEIAAVGGEPTGPRPLAIAMDGVVVARVAAPALAAGERREVVVPLPDAGREERIVEARLEEPRDAVPGNDGRSRAWRSSPPGRTLLVGLAPGWEIGFLRREIERSAAGPVDVHWSATEGSLRAVDAGSAVAWGALDPARYESVWLIGDPALLGPAGRRWLDRYVALPGRGLFWGPGGRGGDLAGMRAPAEGATAAAPPDLTDAGRRWLEGVVGDVGDAPDGTAAWPSLEDLPATRATLPTGAVVLVQAGGRPVAWSVERGGSRRLVALGTGWYRLALEGGEDRDTPSRRFWRAWTEGAVRWLDAASASERPLVAMPAGGRVSAGEDLDIGLAEDAGRVEWRVLPAAGGDPVASGVAEEGAGRIVVESPPPGRWRLEVEATGDREVRAFAVETWTPDLARTEADTTSLAAAARASGGHVIGSDATPLPVSRVGRAVEAGPVVGLGRVPWALLLAAVLLLGHWAVAARAR